MMDWNTLTQTTLHCTACKLCEGRKNVVCGGGVPTAEIMFIGEGPGQHEDEQGEPFVGAAGEDLNGILSLAGLKREDVYIANVLKCRPPGNRNPRPEEVLACSPFLREQIRSIWPDIIVTLGNPATHFVLKTEIGITKLRGRFHQMGHFVVMPTFHPAAALRNPDLPALRRRSQNRGACRQGHAGICIEIARRMRKAFMQKGKRMRSIRFPFFAFCFLRFSALLRVLA